MLGIECCHPVSFLGSFLIAFICRRSTTPIVLSPAFDLSTHRMYAPEQEEDYKPVARMVVYDAVTNPK